MFAEDLVDYFLKKREFMLHAQEQWGKALEELLGAT